MVTYQSELAVSLANVFDFASARTQGDASGRVFAIRGIPKLKHLTPQGLVPALQANSLQPFKAGGGINPNGLRQTGFAVRQIQKLLFS